MKEENQNSGGIAAIKGFSSQFLYTIHHALVHGNDQRYKPEGKEDLDVLDQSYIPLEFIQVKDYGEELVFSKLYKSEHESFVGRAIESVKSGSTATHKLVSFSAFGPELKKAIDGSSLEQLLEKKLPDHEVDFSKLASQIEFVKVNREQLTEELIAAIRETKLFVDPWIALDILETWVRKQSEQQKYFNRQEIIEQLLAIDGFFKQKEQLNELFENSDDRLRLIPLSKKTKADFDRAQLKQDFYQGIAAKFDHIREGIDVVRKAHLVSVSSKFSKLPIVIIRGASGQGKSALAYRFLWEYSSTHTSYELALIENEIDSIKALHALEAISVSIDFPITVYLDVQPGNTTWTSIVKHFSTRSNLRFLITIREDDWVRASYSGYEFRFESHELTLDKDEAKEIYSRLETVEVDSNFTTFNDAWVAFGGNGPLLEFVYLVTEGETLESRLKRQIELLQDEAIKNSDPSVLELLKCTVLFHSMGGRVRSDKLYKKVNATVPERSISRLEKEYLVTRVNEGNWLIGLHPIRSKVLSDILFPKGYGAKRTFITKYLDCLEEGDLNYFILHFCISFPGDENIVGDLARLELETWRGLLQCVSGLLWKGGQDYTAENQTQFDTAYERVKGIWNWAFDLDISTGVTPPIILSKPFKSKDETLLELHKNATPKRNRLTPASQFIANLNMSIAAPESDLEWAAYARLKYWADFLEVDTGDMEHPTFPELAEFATLDLDTQASLLLIYESDTSSDRKSYQDLFIKNLREEHHVVDCRCEEENIHAHFIISDFLDEPMDKGEEGNNDSVHGKALRILSLLRKAFPQAKKYSSNGYGHCILPGMEKIDESRKGISKENLKLPMSVELNSQLINHFEYKMRPESWQQYTDQILDHRDAYLTEIEGLIKIFDNYFRTRRIEDVSKYFKDNLEKWNQLHQMTFPFPKTAVDPWGFSSETISKNDEVDGTGRSKTPEDSPLLSFQKYDRYREYFKSVYSQGLGIFFTQFHHALAERYGEQDEKNGNDTHRITYLLFSACRDLQIFQQEFRAHFEKFDSEGDLEGIEEDEERLFSQLFFLWRKIMFTPSRKHSKMSKLATRAYNDELQNFKKKLKETLEKEWQDQYCQMSFHASEAFPNKGFLFVNLLYVDIPDINFIINLLASVSTALGTPEVTSLKRLVLEQLLRDLVIVMKVKGRILSDHAYEIPIRLLIEEAPSEFAYAHFLPKRLDQEVIDQFELDTWENHLPLLRRIVEIQHKNQTALATILHCLDVLRFNSNRASVSAEIEKYCEEQKSKVIVSLTEVLAKLGEVRSALIHFDPHATGLDYQSYNIAFDNLIDQTGEIVDRMTEEVDASLFYQSLKDQYDEMSQNLNEVLRVLAIEVVFWGDIEGL